jgi:hypothetical protein
MDIHGALRAFSLALHVGGGDGIAGDMPDAKDANVPLLLPDVEYDAIESPALDVKQVTGGRAKLLRFRCDRTLEGRVASSSAGAERLTR